MNPAFSIFSSDKLVLHKLDYISQLYELLLQMLCSVIVCAHSRSCCLRKAPSTTERSTSLMPFLEILKSVRKAAT